MMKIEDIKDNGEYYFVNFSYCHDVVTAVFAQPNEVEEFLNENMGEDFDVIFICKGRLMRAETTEVKTCFKLRNN